MKNKIIEKNMIIGICSLCVMLGIIFVVNKTSSSASTLGYYDEYNNVYDIEVEENETVNIMSVNQNTAYYIKLGGIEADNYSKSSICAYDLKNNKNVFLYNGVPSNKHFKLGKVSGMCLNKNMMYITTKIHNKLYIIRYNISVKNGKYILNNRKIYEVNTNKGVKACQNISSINYVNNLAGFILNDGLNVYYAKFNDRKFQIIQQFELESNIQVNTKDGVEQLDISNYAYQGILCRNNKLYMAMTSKNEKNKSIVVNYNFDIKDKKSKSFKANQDEFVSITSGTYKELFKIENVAIYNNEMYMNINAKDMYGKSFSKIIKLKNFSYN